MEARDAAPDRFETRVNDADDAVAQAIERDGVAVVPRFLADALVARLRERARSLDAEGAFAPAGVGRGSARAHDPAVRGDRIRWIEPPLDPAEAELAAILDDLRAGINRRLALGAFELEMHYAIYPPHGRYVRHRDRFRDDDARLLSCVAYLNDGWGDEEGGELRLHLDAGARDVAPRGGTLVAFLSDRIEHEVLPARRDRLAVAAWFRRR